MSTTRTAKQCGCANVPLRILAQIGLWGDARSFLRRCAPFLALAQATYGLVTQTINVAQTWGKMALAAEFCVMLLQMLMTFVKIRCLVNRAVQIQEAVATLNEMQDAHARTDDVTHILRRTRSTSDKFARLMHRHLSRVIAFFVFCAVVAGYLKHEIPFSFMQTFNASRRWYPYNAKVRPLFDLALLSYGLLAYFDFYVILLFDLLFLCIMIEVIGEFKVLQHRFARLDRPVIPALKLNGNAALQKHWNEALKQHVSVGGHRGRRGNGTGERKVCFALPGGERLVSKLEAIFQPALNIHLVCNLSVGLTLVFVTLKIDKMDVKITNTLAIGVVCIAEFAFYCYFCTQMTTESTQVGESLYACAWWEADAGFKRSLRIVQLRINQPLFIRAAGIFPMSMETFAKVMNTAYNLYGLMISTN